MTDRQDRILELRDEGATLQQIADDVGVTRERVRQILKAEGLKTFRRTDRLAIAIKAWQESGELRRPADVAVEHGLVPNGATVAALRRACAGLTLPDEKRVGSQWSRESIAADLRTLATEHGLDFATDWMRITDYDKWKTPAMASAATIGANYLWSELMTLAGFDARNAYKRGRRPGVGYKGFTDQDLEDAVRAYLDSKPAKLSATGMERFLASDPSLPSMATVRNRYRKRGVGTIAGIFRAVLAPELAASA